MCWLHILLKKRLHYYKNYHKNYVNHSYTTSSVHTMYGFRMVVFIMHNHKQTHQNVLNSATTHCDISTKLLWIEFNFTNSATNQNDSKITYIVYTNLPMHSTSVIHLTLFDFVTLLTSVQAICYIILSAVLLLHISWFHIFLSAPCSQALST